MKDTRDRKDLRGEGGARSGVGNLELNAMGELPERAEGLLGGRDYGS
jgi:hypothetical protein